jgi:hypothetical protein
MAEVACAVAKGVSLTALAEKFRCSTEWVRQVALKCGLRTEDWRKVARLKKQQAIENMQPQRILGLVWDQALAHGLSVKRFVLKMGLWNRGPSSRRLLIQGYRCYVSISRSACQPSGARKYAHHMVVKLKTDFEILVSDVPDYKRRIFVLPWAELKSTDIYVPLEKLPVYKNRRPQIDWWAYENAWHLLKKTGAERVRA